MDFIITVDVEADNQWQRPSTLSVKNIKFLPRFQELCEKYDFKPTYFVTYEVANDNESVKILKDFQNRGSEIGAHLHPWSTPPFFNSLEFELLHHRFPSELSSEELKLKIKNLTALLTKNFGQNPSSFRAGRWGINSGVLEVLADNSYLVDASVTPKVSWAKKDGISEDIYGPDFRSASVAPYYPSQENILASGTLPILEVPMTILCTGFFKKEKNPLVKLFSLLEDSFLKKVLNKIFFRQKWLRIFHNSKLQDWRSIYKSAVANNLPVIQFMIHSSELMPGSSPYAKTDEAVDLIYKQLEEMFNFFKTNNLSGKTLTSFALKYKEYEGANKKIY